MEEQIQQSKQESKSTIQQLTESKLQKTSHSLWKKIFFFISELIIILIIIFFLYRLKFYNKNSKGVAQKNINTKSISSTVLRTKSEKTLPTFIPISQPTNLVYPDQFQKLIAENCKEVYTNPNAFTYFISLDKFPFTIDQSIIHFDKNNPNNNPPFNTPSCIGQPNTDYVTVGLDDKRSLYIYDKFSQELGHGGVSFFQPIPFATTILDRNNQVLSFILVEGMGTVIGQEPIMVRGIKTLTLMTGEQIYATLDITAVDENDPRLIQLLNKYAIPSQFQSGGFDVDSTKTIQYNEDIKKTFFADMNNLTEPEKSRIGDLVTTLSAISTK